MNPINSAVGTGVWVRQCNSFTATNVNVQNSNECFRITGGQLNSFIGCTAFVGDTTIAATEFSGCFVLEEADIGGGNYQPCYTVTITDVRASASKVLNNIILVRSADGLQVTNGYIAYAQEALIRLRRQRVGTNVTAVAVSNLYMDCVDLPLDGVITGTPTAISIGHALPGGNYGAAGVLISNCIIANNDDTGSFNALIDITKYVDSFNLCNCYIANSGPPYAVEIYDQPAASTRGTYNISNNTFSNVSNAAGGGAIYCKDTSQVSITGNTFQFVSSSNHAILFDGTIDSACVVGNTVDGAPSDLVVFANGMTINDNAVALNAGLPSSGKQIVRLSLPTSDTGLPSGSMWNDGGTVKVKA